MSTNEHAFQAHVAAARRGDDDAWRELYAEFAPQVLGYLRAQRAPSPEDLLGEVWLQAVRDLPRFSGDHGGFRAWLLTIAHHRLLDARRAAGRRPVEVPDATTQGDPQAEPTTTEVDRLEAEQELAALLEGLPPRHQSMLYLRYVLDLPQREVARIMGLSTPAAKMLQARAVRSLERRVEQLRGNGALPSGGEGRLT